MSLRDQERAEPEEPSPEDRLRPPSSRSVATRLAPLLRHLFPDGPPIRLQCWDGSVLGPTSGGDAVVLRNSRAVTQLIWSPDELGLARAFIAGDVDHEGDLVAVLRSLHDALGDVRRLGFGSIASGLLTAVRLAAVRRRPRPPVEEVRLWGALHSRRRDALAVTHHYDVGNDFYRLVLGPAMTYSCARFTQDGMTLEQAQRSKHDLICRKLGLHERSGLRLLDVGCGFGSMAMHAAAEYGVQVVGITLSPAQALLARERVHGAGLDGLVEIRHGDYRELRGETFDAISSIGMFEHVGSKRVADYFSTLVALLEPRGRLLNHAISTPGGSRMHGRTFINRYVFPDGELIDVAEVVRAMERAGLELRDVESLREHYSRTLREWVNNLERSWDDAVALVGEARARIWRLYMSASAVRFDDGSLAVHQVLGVSPDGAGSSGMPTDRSGWR